MDDGGNSNFGRGHSGNFQNQGGRAPGRGRKPNRGGGKGGNSLNQPNQGSRRGWYAHHQPPTQGQCINRRGNRPPPTSDPHQICGRAGAWGPSPSPTPPVRPPQPSSPLRSLILILFRSFVVLLSKVMGSSGNNLQRGGSPDRGGRGGGGRRYHHNQTNKGSGRWRESQQHCSSSRLNQKQEQTISRQGQLDGVPASGTGAGGDALAPPAQPGDHLNRVSGIIWSKTWKPPFLPFELRADLLGSLGWRLNRH